MADRAAGFGAVVFRTPDLNAIPRKTWRTVAAQIDEAQKKGLRIVPLSIDEVCELHGARELYSNALQGNIDYKSHEVLQWLKGRFEPWFDRYAQSCAEKARADDAELAAKPAKRDVLPPMSGAQAELSEGQLGIVLQYVSQRMLVDIREVLKT